ncbi:hypothetical protein [Acuticoccus sp.]|uniref:hypothetical protein n=1 Tax=Acuticoccus sp. TaxID=1904378 RepID=UPI003B521BD0
MWFFTEFFERYSRNLARSIKRMTAMEADANRNVVARVGIRRDGANGLILPERSLCVPAPVTTPSRGQVAASRIDEAGDNTAGEAGRALRDAGAGEVASALNALDAMPQGVRGEVVLKYIAALGGAGPRQAAELLEKLRKDKKVRVAELQLIAADLLGEDVTIRRKADHMEALRRRLAPAEPRREPAPMVMHAH